MSKISIFESALNDTAVGQLELTDFLEDIHNGKWQDLVFPIRNEKDERKRTQLKKKLPNVTLSGTFHLRQDEGIIVHSGCIGIDVDDADPEKVKTILSSDPYIYSIFTSISGHGVCIILPIDGQNHRDVFENIQYYMYDRYELVVDPTSVNVSRARYVSFDPHIFINEKAKKFDLQLVEKKEVATKVPTFIFTIEDFEHVVKQIEDRCLDITEGYKNWLKLGFAIAAQFGEAGRTYYQRISQFHPTYTSRATDKQYTACVKAGRVGAVKINTFFYIAKQYGLEIITDRTKKIADIVDQLRKEKRSSSEIDDYLKKEGLHDKQSASIADQVLTGATTGEDNKSKNQIDLVERWLDSHYDIRKNKITRITEVDGKPLTDAILNQIWLDIARIHSKIPFITVARMIESDYVKEYDPFQEWFKENEMRYTPERCRGNIKRLFDTITPESEDDSDDNALFDNEGTPLIDAEYKYDFGRKWMIGLVAAMHGEVVPLMLVLTGLKQNTGKTEWFRRLLPKELLHYYAESKLDAGKDAEILMSKKLLIMDDEMGGKSKMESKRLKELTSADVFTLREPYGRVTVELKRLAVLAGTSNDYEIIMDQTGNRRIIPLSVGSIDHDKYNAIDKSALLMEAYYAFLDGEDFHLKRRDIERMFLSTGKFEMTHLEREALQLYFRKPSKGERCLRLTNTEMKIIIETATNQKVNQTKLGMELKKAQFRRIKILDEHKTQKWVYEVIKKPLFSDDNNIAGGI